MTDRDDLTELGFRTRGRPKLPDSQRRREKLIVALTSEEMRDVMHRAADAPGGPMRIQDWARLLLLDGSVSSAALREIVERMERGQSIEDLAADLAAIRKLIGDAR